MSGAAARRRGSLFVIAAPSGAGKTSLVKALLKDHSNLKFSISYTTRPKRPNDEDGRDYHECGLRRPPHGYHWVRVDHNAVLAVIATGVVLDVIYNQFW